MENTGEGPEDVRVELGGDAGAWGWVTPATMSVEPGQRATAAISFRVPKASHPPAGPVAFTLSLVSGGGDRDFLDGRLDLAPFVDVHAGLDPRTSRGRTSGHHVLRVENRGNAPVGASLEAEGEEVSVEVDRTRIEAQAGETVEVGITVRARRQRFRGSTTTRPFEVVVQPDGMGQPVRADGAVALAPAGWMGRAALLLLALAVVAVAAGGFLLSPSGDEQADEAAPSPVQASSDCPARDHLSPDANGIIRPDVPPSFDYTFLFVRRQDCQPVRFNPCQPVRYALNRRLATDAHVADLLEALRKLADATGLEFERVADTEEDPRVTPRVRRQPDGTLAWPPVVIGWSHLGKGESLRSRGAVRSTPDVVVGGGGRPEIVNDVIVTGNLILNLDAVTDTDTNAPVPHGFGPGVNWGRIILHELAHVIGLGHVESRTSIMNEALTQQTISSSQWGVGDLVGLRQLGREGGCVDVPPVPFQGAPR